MNPNTVRIGQVSTRACLRGNDATVWIHRSKRLALGTVAPEPGVATFRKTLGAVA